jgi:MFS family permease
MSNTDPTSASSGAPSAPVTPAPEKPSALALLRVFRHRNYRLFFSGQLVSLMGAWITQVAQGWLVYSLSHSPFLLGLTSFCGLVPVFFTTAFGGMVADRVDRRRLLMVTQSLAMCHAATLAVLTLTGVVQVWMIVSLALFKGLVNAFDVPTRQALIIDMVGREDLRNAISLNSITFNLARVIGPTVAGIIIAVAGEGVCFTIDAMSYGAVLVSLVMMVVPSRPRREMGAPLTEIRDGFRYAWNARQIRIALLMVAACAAFGAAYVSQLPAFARDVLQRGATGLGFLTGSIGIGALVGAYFLARVPEKYLTLTPIIAAITFGLSLIGFSQSHVMALSMAMLVPAGASLVLLGGSTNTIIQTLTHDHMRGRIVSLYTMSFMGMMPWGALILGTLATHLGVGNAVTLGGGVCLIAAASAFYARHGQFELVAPAE